MRVEWMTRLGVTQVYSHWKDMTCEGRVPKMSCMHGT